MANRGQGAQTPTTATGRERTTLALVDIAPPGVSPAVGVFAFRAGDEIPPAWLEEQREYLDGLGEVNGSPVYRAGTLAEAQQVAEEGARGAGSQLP
jgi:hypothetical protein